MTNKTERVDIMEELVYDEVRLRAAVNLNRQAKKYIFALQRKTNVYIWIGIVLGFSVSNLIIPYLMDVPVLGDVLEFIMEFAEWGGNMLPAAYIPKALMDWQIDAGQWIFGIALAVLTLLPYGIAWLITGGKRKTGACRVVFVLYAIDTAVFLWDSVFLFIDALACDISTWTLVMFVFWKLVDIGIRCFVFTVLAEEISLPKARKIEWDKLVDRAYEWYAAINGEEEAKKQPRKNAEIFSMHTVVNITKNPAEAEKLERVYAAYEAQRGK